MEVVLLLLCWFLQFQSAISLNCFNCYDENYRSCDAAQKIKSCHGNSKQCYSLRYYNVLDKGGEEHGFKKGCVTEGTDCQAIRQRYMKLGYNECKVFCCEGDECNKNGFQDLADQSKKTKRSSLGDSSNSSSQYICSLNFIAHALLLLTLRLFLT